MANTPNSKEIWEEIENCDFDPGLFEEGRIYALQVSKTMLESNFIMNKRIFRAEHAGLNAVHLTEQKPVPLFESLGA